MRKRPTEQEINRKAAEVCGWREVTFEHPYLEGWTRSHSILWVHPTNQYSVSIPNFCRDRNALPALLEEMVRRDSFSDYTFIGELGALRGIPPTEGRLAPWAFRLMTSSPREITEAALRALGAWEWGDQK